MTPYYEESGIQIFHGDCRKILPSLPQVDLVLTDPPYPDYHATAYRYDEAAILPLRLMACRQLIFWTAKESFPLDHTAIHIWDKRAGGLGSFYERLFERNGGSEFRVFNYISVNNSVRATFAQDEIWDHPSQKPIKLLKELVSRYSDRAATILDPFMGSGTTLRAAKDLGRKAIGIEIEEKYCEIAANRLRQEVFNFPITQVTCDIRDNERTPELAGVSQE